MIFPASGVETYLFIPPLVAFVISFFSSMAGLSGAFFILPFQMSVFGFTSPSVSSTNFLYNVVSIPGGVLRFIREKRMSWPLIFVIVAGTFPGVFAGYFIRIRYLPDPKAFKLFVGLVLFYIGIRLIRGFRNKRKRADQGDASMFVISNVSYSLKRISYDFNGETFSFSVPAMFLLSAIVGIIGGIYGIGGGAIIAPFCVSVFGLPVYTVAGAALMGTLITSVAGVFVYSIVPFGDGMAAPPDWSLGALFGLGGLAGIYLGAKVQRFMPERVIKVILALIIFWVSARYIYQFIAG
ncbi:MAG: sulfite exporter TauE/SafE family protein [Nitrospirota bacterium]|nr:MAG: sulfite exporter TauE/SafE family protein [Nitrospirota bacterium]